MRLWATQIFPSVSFWNLLRKYSKTKLIQWIFQLPPFPPSVRTCDASCCWVYWTRGCRCHTWKARCQCEHTCLAGSMWWVATTGVNEYNIKRVSYMWLFKSPGVGKVFVQREHLWGFVWAKFQSVWICFPRSVYLHMSHLVVVEVWRRSESLSADVTFVRFLSRVDSAMSVQGGARWESFLADIAHVRSLPSVSSNVAL